MKNLKKTLLTVAATLAVFGLNFVPMAGVYAATDICSQSNVPKEVRDANGCDGGSAANLEEVIVNIISGIVGALALVAVIFIVVGGINYMTSAGDAGKIQKAKSTILYAVIGLIIAVLAFAIVNFVIKNILLQK